MSVGPKTFVTAAPDVSPVLALLRIALTDVGKHADTEPQVRLGVDQDLDDLGPLPLGASGTGLVRPESLNGLRLLVVVGEESGAGNVRVKTPPDNGGRDDGDETGEEVEDLPLVQGPVGDVAKAVGEDTGDDSGDSVGSVPGGDSQGLLGSSVPLRGDQAEQRETSSLEQSEEESSDVDVAVVGRCSHASGRDTPAENKDGHEVSSGESDEDECGERLPGELSNSVDRSRHRVLLSCQSAGWREGETLRNSPVKWMSSLNPNTFPKPKTTLSKI